MASCILSVMLHYLDLLNLQNLFFFIIQCLLVNKKKEKTKLIKHLIAMRLQRTCVYS